MEGQSDIDIAIYTEDFDLYKRISVYLEDYFAEKRIESDIFYIDLTMEAPVYCAPLKSKVQFTDYYPEKLVGFGERCQHKLEPLKEKEPVNVMRVGDMLQFMKSCAERIVQKSEQYIKADDVEIQMDCIDIVTAYRELKKCIWYNGSAKESLLEGFLKN